MIPPVSNLMNQGAEVEGPFADSYIPNDSPANAQQLLCVHTFPRQRGVLGEPSPPPGENAKGPSLVQGITGPEFHKKTANTVCLCGKLVNVLIASDCRGPNKMNSH